MNQNGTTSENANEPTAAALDGTGVERAGDVIETSIGAVEESHTVERALFEDPRPEAYPMASALDGCRRTAERGAAISGVALQSAARAQSIDGCSS